MKQPVGACRIGVGFDAHRFSSSPKRRLRLGGVHIPFPKGLAGYSDADVLLHAVMDALLGALALPDIGTRFPDTDPEFRDADSAVLLENVMRHVARCRYNVVNLDCVLVCDRPKLAPYARRVRTRIAGLLGISPYRVGLQAKTCEGTSLAIPGKSIAALAVVLLEREGRPRGHATKTRRDTK